MTQLEWYAYLLFKRDSFSTILASGRLFQELAVDMYVALEHSRLKYFENNQTRIRAELYTGVLEAMDNEAEGFAGRRVILPSSFIGGPRHMQQLYQDSMALVAKYGRPSLFITMTANPNWPEIVDCLEYEQRPEDRPDLVARVFHMRFHCLLDDVTKHGRLGNCVSYCYTIEFQKRGLPHAHLILILDPASTPRTRAEIDLIVSAELPDPDSEPQLNEAVTQFMLHGPCIRGRKCYTEDGCRLRFPRPFSEETTLSEDSYPCYRRLDNGRRFQKGQTIYHNGHVVPYSRYLLLKYQCHINVEIAISIKAIKYLYKYISKGHDRTNMTIEQLENEGADESLAFVNGRYVSAQEGELARLHPIED